ncbi:MAG: nuclear transport factor 2 family protein [Planctomycetes bacterium]|nr:nuclear transport factor 2 family protein [Planctomycetota bacterium]
MNGRLATRALLSLATLAAAACVGAASPSASPAPATPTPTPPAARADAADAADAADEEAVRATVAAFFAALEQHDAAAIERLVAFAPTLLSVAPAAAGAPGPQLQPTEWKRFVASLRAATRAYREQFVEPPTVLLDGDLAVVFGRYRFDLDGAPHHRGVDAFTLARTAAGWRIVAIADTRLPP